MSEHEPTHHEFANAQITARVQAQGAELCLLRDHNAVDYLWPAAPPWPRHAPILFPIIGRLPNDTLLHEGQSYHLTQHGFARDRRFQWLEREPTGCRLVLTDDAQSRAQYPFPFRLEVRYALAGATLEISFTAINPGNQILPASLGAHPAFRWPLQPGRAKDAYSLTFEAEETAPIRSVSGGLLTPSERPSPVQNRRLALTQSLFADDALIFPAPASRSVRYAADQGPALTVSWQAFPQLGIWSRPDADLLCIEPWYGMSTPAGFTGPFDQKPGLIQIPPGEQHTSTHRITVQP